MPAEHRPAIRVERIGIEAEPIVVVDGFSPHPDRLVAEAAALDFTAMGEFYPGVRAKVSPLYFDGVGPLVASALRNVFGYQQNVRVDRALYSLVTATPQNLTLAQRIPHVDSVDDGMIAILHYLTPGDLGGTAFYRHRSTGFETVDADRHAAYLSALHADIAQHGEPPPAYISGDTEIFERTALFAPAYNRALIYRSSLLHCADVTGDARSADVRAGRLTVASFLFAQ